MSKTVKSTPKAQPAVSLPEVSLLGKKAPRFTLPATGDKTISLASLKNKTVVLYFYPRDNTPGCTTEAGDFKQLASGFGRTGTVVLGISQDPMKSHDKFQQKLLLPFDLLSDEEGVVCKRYGCLKLKKMYGKEFIGIERSTFVIDKSGVVRQEYRKVRVPGHVDEVLEFVKSL